MFKQTSRSNVDFFLTKQREKAKREAEMKMTCTMTQKVPVGESKTTTSLTTMLGQYSISPMEFHKRFDSLTTTWTKGTIVPVRVVKKLRAAEFELTVNSVSFPFLVSTARFHNALNTASANVIYDIIRFKAKELKKPFKLVARMVFSTMSSCKIKKLSWQEHPSMLPDFKKGASFDDQE